MTVKNRVKAGVLRILRRFRAGGFTRPFTVLVLALIAWELGDILAELRGLRREQVKNAAYALHPKTLDRLRSQSSSASARNRLRILSAEIAGIENNVTVEIER